MQPSFRARCRSDIVSPLTSSALSHVPYLKLRVGSVFVAAVAVTSAAVPYRGSCRPVIEWPRSAATHRFTVPEKASRSCGS